MGDMQYKSKMDAVSIEIRKRCKLYISLLKNRTLSCSLVCVFIGPLLRKTEFILSVPHKSAYKYQGRRTLCWHHPVFFFLVAPFCREGSLHSTDPENVFILWLYERNETSYDNIGFLKSCFKDSSRRFCSELRGSIKIVSLFPMKKITLENLAKCLYLFFIFLLKKIP